MSEKEPAGRGETAVEADRSESEGHARTAHSAATHDVPEPSDDFPLLTDIVPDPVLIEEDSFAGANGETGAVQVISRVQTQNLQHIVYQRLRKDLDAQIAEVVRDQFIPDIGSALGSVLERVAKELQGNIGDMVRTSVEQALQAQLAPLRRALESSSPDLRDASAIMPSLSAPPASSMELAKSFEPARDRGEVVSAVGSRAATSSRPRSPGVAPYCIQLPPPNVTGTLHMGHAFQQTLMDVLIRYHRMRGFNTLWQLGTDHAGIATQIVVEQQLEGRRAVAPRPRTRRIRRARVGSGRKSRASTITSQMRRLGASARLVARALHDGRGPVRGGRETFVRLHEDGLIYRGKRLVNWDSEAQTAVSDLEVDNEEEQGKLWEIRYPLARRRRFSSSSRRRGPRRCWATSRSR